MQVPKNSRASRFHVRNTNGAETMPGFNEPRLSLSKTMRANLTHHRNKLPNKSRYRYVPMEILTNMSAPRPVLCERSAPKVTGTSLLQYNSLYRLDYSLQVTNETLRSRKAIQALIKPIQCVVLHC